MKKIHFLFSVLILLLTSCEKETIIVDDEIIDVGLYYNSAYGELKLDETNWDVTTDGVVIDTIANSYLIRVKESNSIILNTDFKKPLTTRISKGGVIIKEYEMLIHSHIVFTQDSLVIVN